MEQAPKQAQTSEKQNKRKLQAEALRNFCEALRASGYKYVFKTTLFTDSAVREHVLYSKDGLSRFEYETQSTDRPEMATIVRAGIVLVFFQEDEALCELATEVIKHWPPEEFSRHPREIKPTVYGVIQDELFIAEDNDLKESKQHELA